MGVSTVLGSSLPKKPATRWNNLSEPGHEPKVFLRQATRNWSVDRPSPFTPGPSVWARDSSDLFFCFRASPCPPRGPPVKSKHRFFLGLFQGNHGGPLDVPPRVFGVKTKSTLLLGPCVAPVRPLLSQRSKLKCPPVAWRKFRQSGLLVPYEK